MSLSTLSKTLLTLESMEKAMFSPFPPKDEEWIDLRSEFPPEAKPPETSKQHKKHDTITRWTMITKEK